MKCNFFFEKSGRGTEKSSKTWKSRLKFFWNVLCDQWPQNWKVVGPNFLRIQQAAIKGFMVGYVKPLNFFTFFDFSHLQGVTGVGGWDQSWTKKANFGCHVSVKIKIFQRLFKRCLFLLNNYLWWKLQQNWTIFEGVRIHKLCQRRHFMDAESVSKNLKIFNLTNYKCYTDKTYQDYLHKTFNLVKLWGATNWA